jgi:hypothetical protein
MAPGNEGVVEDELARGAATEDHDALPELELMAAIFEPET